MLKRGLLLFCLLCLLFHIRFCGTTRTTFNFVFDSMVARAPTPSSSSSLGSAAPSKVVLSYYGAIADGVTPDPLNTLPAAINMLALAFAQDTTGNGNFVPFSGWQIYGITATAIASDKQVTGRRYLVSLAGDRAYWKAGTNCNVWVSNAFSSVKGIINSLGLDGVDVNYENGALSDPSFSTCIVDLFQQLRQWQPNIILTLAPFASTWNAYLPIVNASPNLVDFINYQSYAEQFNTAQELVNRYQALSTQVPYSKLMVGYSPPSPSNPSGRGGPGDQVPAVYDALAKLLQYGIRGVVIWTAEFTKPTYSQEQSFALILDRSCTRVHTVVAGDICYNIATAAGLTVEQLLTLNPNLNCNNLQIGQTICTADSISICSATHTVVPGDTCFGIATNAGVSLYQLFALNPGLDCNFLQVGEELCIASSQNQRLIKEETCSTVISSTAHEN